MARNALALIVLAQKKNAIAKHLAKHLVVKTSRHVALNNFLNYIFISKPQISIEICGFFPLF
jgi:hypothetical protein